MSVVRTKKAIEIYFILYLAALVFLIPDGRTDKKQDGSDEGIQFITPKFALFPEKTNLTCRLIMDSTGPRILSIDSVNRIYYSGDVEDVKFEFIIEDQFLKQNLVLTSDVKPRSRFFRLEKEGDRQSILFYWEPPINERQNKTYLVRVNAYGSSRSDLANTKGVVDPGKVKQIYKVTQQFSLLMIFVNEPQPAQQITQQLPLQLLGIDTLFRNLPQFQQQTTSVPIGPIQLLPDRREISAIAYQQWTNTVYINNANPIKDLSKIDLQVRLDPPDNRGVAEILDKGENKLIIHGKTPSTGRMVVELSVHRKYDNADASIRFTVTPTPFEQPDFPKIMYPEQRYTFDPKMPLLGIEPKAYLKEGNIIRAKSNQGEKFTFTPEITDTGKVFTFERYIDNELLGEKHFTRVVNYPDPIIYEIIYLGQTAEVITQSYGFKDKERNEVVDFIIEGNAKWQDMRGKMTILQDKATVIQHFRFEPANPSKPFQFKIQAVDKRGKVSLPKSHRGG
ncbi:MAG: hypothetical protein N2319_01005 [Candidatus Kapabacteria bacterium]|nr:hypothetical protein [Candidatus Kapabacteria bacterium]